jgi:hypothetical protein
MRAYRTIVAASLTAVAACSGPDDANRVVADNVEFLPEEALLNDVAGRSVEAGDAEVANLEGAGVIPEPVAPAPPSPPQPRKPKESPPKTVPDARPIIDPPPVERPDIHVEPATGNVSNSH